MSPRSGGSAGGRDDRTWLPGGYGEDSGPRRRVPGGTRTSRKDSSQTGPPWDDAGSPWADPAEPDLAAHPSGPLPVPPDDPGWPIYQAESGYDGDQGSPGGHGDYSRYPDDTGYGYEQDDTGYGFQRYDDSGYDGGDTGYQGYHGGYEPGAGYDHPGDEQPGYETGTGYDAPGYDTGYQAGPDAYADYDYPPGADDDQYGQAQAGQAWGDGYDEDEFLPGMSGRTAPAQGAQPPRGSGRPYPERPRGRGKGKGVMRRVAPWLALFMLVIILAPAAGVGYYYYSHYLHPPDYTGPGTGTLIVQIKPGDSAAVVGLRLQQLGVVKSERAFANAARASGHGSALEPGYYRVHEHMQASLAFALLLNPQARIQTRITVPEGLRLTQIIALLGKDTGDPSGYAQAIKDVKALNLPSFAGGNPEGYLFPATYEVQPNTPPVKVLQQMVLAFDHEAASVHLPSAAAQAFLKQNEVITVASLIQAEGGRLSDFPKIAEVIYNRLNQNPQMPLQLDSTVMYALHTYGIRATTAQTKVNSLYNTYTHTGLPPGPIDSPGDAAIQAALHPAHGSYLWFVTVDPKTGLTKFTSSFAQFQQFEAELSANLASGK